MTDDLEPKKRELVRKKGLILLSVELGPIKRPKKFIETFLGHRVDILGQKFDI